MSVGCRWEVELWWCYTKLKSLTLENVSRMGGRTMVVLLPTWLSRTSSTPPSPSSTFRMFLLTSKFIRKWYHVTVKHQNLDFGKLEQKLSDQQKFRSFAINVICTITSDIFNHQTSKITDFWHNWRFFEGLGSEILLYASWKKNWTWTT